MKINFFRWIFLIALLNTCLLLAERETRVEFRTGAFFPSSKFFKDIYGRSAVDFQFQAATEYCNFYELWTNFDWFSKHGHSIGFRDPTRVSIVNFSFGMNFLYPLNRCDKLYAGIGPSIGTVSVKNKFRRGSQRVSKTVVGGVVKAGLYLSLTDHLYADLFVDYLYQRVHFHKNVNIGGLKTGLGIGLVY